MQAIATTKQKQSYPSTNEKRISRRVVWNAITKRMQNSKRHSGNRVNIEQTQIENNATLAYLVSLEVVARARLLQMRRHLHAQLPQQRLEGCVCRVV
jgi:hypothetical protein